jgi:hypothetical protein
MSKPLLLMLFLATTPALAQRLPPTARPANTIPVIRENPAGTGIYGVIPNTVGDASSDPLLRPDRVERRPQGTPKSDAQCERERRTAVIGSMIGGALMGVVVHHFANLGEYSQEERNRRNAKRPVFIAVGAGVGFLLGQGRVAQACGHP